MAEGAQHDVHRRFEESVVARRQASSHDNPMPQVSGNRHFMSEEDASKDRETFVLWERFEMNRFLGDRKPHYVPYKDSTLTHCVDLLVQNLPMFYGPDRVTTTTPADYERYLETVLRHETPPDFAIRVSCTDVVFGKYVKFNVRSSHPLRLNDNGGNHSYPVIMDRLGFHVGDTKVMEEYAKTFSRHSPRKQQSMPMSMEERHYLTGGLPCNLLKIQVLPPTTTEELLAKEDGAAASSSSHSPPPPPPVGSVSEVAEPE